MKLEPSQVATNLLSRYVVWNTMTPQVTRALQFPATSHGLFLLVGNLEAAVPTSVGFCTRLAIRSFLASTNTGAEVSVSRAERPFWLAACDRTPLEELGLSVRSYNCLKSASIETLEQLVTCTPARLARLQHFGAKCLTEVTRLLKELGYVAQAADSPFSLEPQSGQLAMAGCPFACLLAIEEAVLQGELRQKLLRCGWLTVGDMARHTLVEVAETAGLTHAERRTLEIIIGNLSLSLPVPQPEWVSAHTADLRRIFAAELSALGAAVSCTAEAPVSGTAVFDGCPRSLNEELERLIPTGSDQRNRAVLTGLFGLDGSDPLTLEQLSKRFIHPTSRERIRQIGLPFLQALQAEGQSMLWLRRALTLLRDEAPCPQQHAERRLLETGIAASALSVVAVLRLLDRAGFDHPFMVAQGQVIPKQLLDMTRAAAYRAYRDCARWGVADWENSGLTIPAWADAARALMPDATWLCPSGRYFTFVGRKNSLANRLARILNVTPRVSLSVAYTALFRDPKVDRTRLLREWFPAFCRVWPWCRVEGNYLLALRDMPPVYLSGDDRLVAMIREFGRPVTREEIYARAALEGISDATINQSLRYSNVLTGVDGLYAVVGS